jgi:hypothetical protein
MLVIGCYKRLYRKHKPTTQPLLIRKYNLIGESERIKNSHSGFNFN